MARGEKIFLLQGNSRSLWWGRLKDCKKEQEGLNKKTSTG